MILEDGSWVLIRPSGTEPIVRVYLEAKSNNDMKQLEDSVRKLLNP